VTGRALGDRDDLAGTLERQLGAALGVDAPVLCRSGRDGFLGLLLALEVTPDDEIVLPVSICQTMVNAVLLAGALPVLVDCRPDLSLCPADLARRITLATRVIVAHHPHGAACRLDDVRAAADAADAILVEDCAQAAGAFAGGVPVGRCGDAVLYSFAHDKPLGAGGGGLVAARDPRIATRLRAALRVGSPGHPDDRALGVDSLPREPELAAIARAVERFPDDIATRVRKAEEMIDTMVEGMAAIGPWGRVVGHELAGRRPSAHVFHRVVVELCDCRSRADVARVVAEVRRTTPPALHTVVQDAVPIPPHRTPHVERCYRRRGRAAPGGAEGADFPGWRAIERSYVFVRTSSELTAGDLTQVAAALSAAATSSSSTRAGGAARCQP
jgi:dTDP-4-amino-4,6-dideoxygalactose transaminase